MSDSVEKLEGPLAQIETTGLDGMVILVSAADRETQSVLAQSFGKVNGIEFDFAGIGLVPMAAIKSAIKAPDALFFQARNEEQGVDWIQALRTGAGSFRRHLVVLLPSPTKSAVTNLLQAGADDVLSTRPDPAEITHSLARARTVSRDLGSIAPRTVTAEPAGTDNLDTRLIVFVHAAGGAGATTLAVNSAVQLHNRIKDNKGGACLIDLDFQFGDAHLHLDLAVQSRMLDLANAPERLDRRMLDDLMINGPNGLRVLTAPEAPMPLDAVGAEGIDAILSLARRRYRYVVVDMPHALAHWTEAALKRADHIFLVTQINIPALRAARKLLDTIRTENITRAPITVVANRYGGSPSSTRLPLQQAARALDVDVSVAIPSDYKLVMDSLDQGVPISTLKPGAKVTLAIAEMLDAAMGAKTKIASTGIMGSLAKFGRK
jgi:Flp pilus assembly CpaE family ATPase